jgi:site-specific DNA-methyltransferase (adenine-specific)
MTLELDTVHCGDCLKLMQEIPTGGIDMVLCDLPYGTTENSWDARILPMDQLWAQYKRIVKPSGVVALFAAQPFTAQVVMSNIKNFKYELIWEKGQGTGFLNAKKQPLRNHESILVFYEKQPTYNPQMLPGKPYTCKKGGLTTNYRKDSKEEIITVNNGERYPLSVLHFPRDKNKLHPTQKPVALCEWLIKTYTNPGETVLDNCMGSGSTMIACINTQRHFLGIEINPEYVNKSVDRALEHLGCSTG